jgi:hypothetical protein
MTFDLERSEKHKARMAAYWTPERRAMQWARANAHAAGADAYNAVMRESNYRAGYESAQAAHCKASHAALESLLASPAFEAKVAQKRAARAT